MALKMENFRLSLDGKRIEKRLGLAEEVTNFAEDVYGYATYRDSSSNFCQLAILESEIQRKVGSGAWTNIHDFVLADGTTPTTIAHPVKPIEVQGKQFIINEVNSRMIHHNGTDYQIGITAPGTVGTTPPVTIPTTTTTYSTETQATMALNDPMTTITDWTDGDTGNGISAAATSGPTTGPDGDAKYMKFSASAPGGIARRYRTLTSSLGSKYTLEFNWNPYGGTQGGYGFHISIYNGRFRFPIVVSYYGMEINDSKNNWFSFVPSYGWGTDNWWNWKFEVDGSDPNAISVKCYLDGIYKSTVTYAYLDTTNSGLVDIWQDEDQEMVAYLDSIKIASSATVTTTTTTTTETDAPDSGKYRYAMTYFRGGNYGAESNPLKSVVGAKSFTGTGTNDMTTGGTYTASSTKVFRVQIDGTGTPDTIKWSEDAGATWKSILVKIGTTVYLSYGITLTFATTTGHTSGDYWAFTCYAWAGTPVEQIVNLSSLPVSSDAQVTGRKLYRTTAGGSRYYWLATINDNTSTTFVDNIPDMALGDEMEEDHDVMPNGKFAAWWDDRMWVSGDDIVYYSQTGYPEHFCVLERYVTVQKGDMGDEITGLVAYKDSLYVFRKRSIYAIQKNSIGYGIYLVDTSTGCRAPWSIVEVNNMLLFISDRGLEVFNGESCYPKSLSDPIKRTIGTINTSYYDLISAVLVPQKYEIWFSVPDRTSGSAVTIVYNYVYDKFYFFSFYKTPSCLVSCENSTYGLVTKMGTRDGYLCLCESTYRDNTTAITATYRTGWYGGNVYEDIRMIETEYEIPASMTLTLNVYVNQDKDVFRTAALTGSTPTSTDIELRRPICDKTELGQRGEYYAFEYTNAENLGGDLKLNKARFFHVPTVIKGKIVGD